MGQLFDALKTFLGSALSFFFDLLSPPLDPGVGLGLSIILLTISINILVFPLTLKQTRATRAFTEIQPKIKKIQAEFKDDPQEMQRRLLEAQKEAGATPGGCLLPLLIQMPIVCPFQFQEPWIMWQWIRVRQRWRTPQPPSSACISPTPVGPGPKRATWHSHAVYSPHRTGGYPARQQARYHGQTPPISVAGLQAV
jgi:hypothetical protein